MADLVFRWRGEFADYERGADSAKKKTKAAFDELDKGAKEGRKHLSSIAGEFDKLVKRAAVAGVAISAAIGGAAVVKAEQFDSAFSNVITLFDGAEDAAKQFRDAGLGSFDDVKSSIQGMAGILGSSTDLTRSFYQSISAGVEPAKALDTVHASASLAAAGLADIEASTKAVAVVMNSFPNVVGGAEGAADVLFTTVKQGVISVDQLAGKLGTILPSAKLAKVGFEEVSAAVATLSLTQPAEIAMTNLKGLFSSMVKSTDQFAKAGIDLQEVMSTGGLAGVLEVLREKFAGNEAGLLKLVGGSTEAVAALVPLIEQQEKYGSVLDANKNSLGTVAQAVDTQTQSFAGMRKELTEQVNNALIRLGTVLLTEVQPGLRGVTERFREWVGTDQFKRGIEDLAIATGVVVEKLVEAAKWVYENRAALASLAAVATGAWGISKIVAFVGAVKSIGTAIATVEIASTAAAGGVTTLGAALGPVVLVIGAATAAAYGLQKAFDAWDRSQDAAIQKIRESASESAKLGIALRAMADESGQSVGELREKFESFADVQAALGGASHQLAKVGLTAVTIAMRETGVASEQAGTAIEQTSHQLDVIGDAKHSATLEQIRAGMAAMAEAGLQGTEEFKRLQVEAARLEKALKDKAAAGAAEAAAKFREMVDAVKSAAGIISDGQLVQKYQSLQIAMKESGLSGKLLTDAFGDQVLALDKQRGAMGLSNKELELHAARTLIAKANANLLHGAEVDIKTALEDTGPTIRDVNEELETNAWLMDGARREAERYQAEVDHLADSFIGAALGARSFGDLVGGLGDSIAQTFQSGKGFGDVFASIKSAFSQEGKTSMQKFGDGLSGALGPLLDSSQKWGTRIGGSVGGGIGGYFGGPLGAALGSKIGGAIGGLFNKKTVAEKVSKDMEKLYGQAVSEGLSKAIAATKKEFGTNRELAAVLNLDAIAKEVKVTGDNIDTFAGQFGQLAVAAQGSGKLAAEAVKKIGPAFGEIIGQARAAKETGTAAFGAMVASAKEFIGESAEVTAFFREGFALASEGAKEFVSIITDAKGDLASFAADGKLAGQIIGDTFEAMLLLPGGAREALGSLGDSVDALSAKYAELGQAVPPEVADAISLRDKYKNVEPLLGQVDALTKVMTGLGETGFIAGDTFATMQQKAVSMTDALRGGLGSNEEALRTMAPLLQQIINEHQRNGKEIDAATMQLIEQADALDLVKIAGTDAFAQMKQQADITVSGFAAVIGAAFGKEGVVQKALGSWRDSMGATSQAVTQSFTASADASVAAFESAAGHHDVTLQRMYDSANRTAQGIASAHAATSEAMKAVTASSATEMAAVTASAASSVTGLGHSVRSVVADIQFRAGGVKNALEQLRDLDLSALNQSAEPRAAGGTIFRGDRYKVGEEGPELGIDLSGRASILGARGPEIGRAPFTGVVVPAGPTAAIRQAAASAPASGGSQQPIVIHQTIHNTTTLDGEVIDRRTERKVVRMGRGGQIPTPERSIY